MPEQTMAEWLGLTTSPDSGPASPREPEPPALAQPAAAEPPASPAPRAAPGPGLLAGLRAAEGGWVHQIRHWQPPSIARQATRAETCAPLDAWYSRRVALPATWACITLLWIMTDRRRARAAGTALACAVAAIILAALILAGYL